ncbi:hypothetical protein N007_00990 [Alicyclobacillus acidoterrestris ATCC 49025]|nr:hypothetical protein N007_00990 [Alicyclobacillus acidoterrestris ATCC 49025]
MGRVFVPMVGPIFQIIVKLLGAWGFDLPTHHKGFKINKKVLIQHVSTMTWRAGQQM